MSPSSPASSTTARREAVDAVGSLLSGWERDVRTLAQDFAALLASPRRPVQWSATATAGARELSQAFLSARPYALGAGATLAEDAFAAGTDLLPWWLSAEQGPVRLSSKMSASTARSYDHQNQPYFVRAMERDDVVLWGPYVDYLCADEYVLTCVAPLWLSGPEGVVRGGVAGFDLRVEDFETLLMPALMELPRDTALLAGSGRVLLANSGRFLVGERPSPEGLHLREVGPSGLGVALLGPRG